jgi:hypothetical protein
MIDIPICGYSLENGIFCREPRDRDRCTKHDQPSFSVCTGCSGRAAGECGAGLSTGHPCLRPICNECRHVADGDMHIPNDSAEEERPFAAQRPGSSTAATVRTKLIGTVENTLRHAAQAGLIKFQDDPYNVGMNDEGIPYCDRVASMIVDEVTAEAFGRMLAGIAMGQVGG